LNRRSRQEGAAGASALVSGADFFRKLNMGEMVSSQADRRAASR
jgi:hypothetical protein